MSLIPQLEDLMESIQSQYSNGSQQRLTEQPKIGNMQSDEILYFHSPFSDFMIDFGVVKKLFLTCIISGNVCCTQYAEDGCWYRATIYGITRDNVKVQFADYGRFYCRFVSNRPCSYVGGFYLVKR